MIVRLLLLGALLALVALPASASAEIASREAIALRNQILEVQNQLDQLQKQVDANARRGDRGSALGNAYSTPAAPQNPGGSNLVANLLQQVSSLQDQVRDLRGKVDDLTNSVDQKIADLDKKVGDLKFQFQLTQGKETVLPGTTPPGSTAHPSASSSPPPAARPSAGVLLQRGQAALTRADYSTAASNAEEILHVDAHSPVAYDAEFLLARALFGEKQYTRAALAYDDAYGRAPVGLHAQDSLLGLARSLARIDQHPAACAAITKLHHQFSTLHADVEKGAAEVSREAQCT